MAVNLKIQRKARRKQAQYLRHEPDTDIKFQEESSSHLFIGNGGLKNGVSREVLEYILNSFQSQLEYLYLPSGKDYAFASFNSPAAASECLTALNGQCIQEVCGGKESLLQSLTPALLSGPPVHLFLSYVNKIPSNVLGCQNPEMAGCNQLPPGLVLLYDFVSTAEEDQLMKFFPFSCESNSQTQAASTTTDTAQKSDKLTPQQADLFSSVRALSNGDCYPPKASLKHRKVMHYGYEFLYDSNLVDPTSPLPGGLPSITHPLLERMLERGLINEHPDQLTVNQYSPGAGTTNLSIIII